MQTPIAPVVRVEPLVAFAGRAVFIGFGSIGQGLLPMLLKHVGGLTPDRVTIVTADERGKAEAEYYGVRFIVEPLKPDNYREVLDAVTQAGDFLVNVSVDVSSAALIEFAGSRDLLYIDTVVEPWIGGYTDSRLSLSERSNYAQREAALAVRKLRPGGPTAVLTHGANPGLVSHFVKEALLAIARETSHPSAAAPPPSTRAEWAALAHALGVTTIHIAERDTQESATGKRPNEFVNTWSVDGFVSEGLQPAELGWGTHERALPADARRHEFGCDAAVYLLRPGVHTRVRSWTPSTGPYAGWCITHNEAISIADYLTVTAPATEPGGDGNADGSGLGSGSGSGSDDKGDDESGDVKVVYRPTVHYAYAPTDAAILSLHELVGRALVPQEHQRIMVDDVVRGSDELGVLLAGHAKNAYWFGSSLSIGETRALAPFQNATALQVTAAMLGAIVWAIENPERGIVEPEEMDHERVLAIARPYLGRVFGEFTSWTPLTDRGSLFPEVLDHDDPWQFSNVRVL